MDKKELKEYKHQWYLKHKESIKEKSKEYYNKNKESEKNKKKKYYYNNKETRNEYQKKYRKTPMGRASILYNGYKTEDFKHNRGKCTLTAKWIVENIFSQPCVHCGETDWTKIGCNRLDNSKPHTPDNVEPCCFKCNKKLERSKRG